MAEAVLRKFIRLLLEEHVRSSNIWVCNVLGTAGQSPPRPHDSWLEYWREEAGVRVRVCQAVDCSRTDIGGAHVTLFTEPGRFIVPLCGRHNPARSDACLQLKRDAILIPARTRR